MACAQDDGSAQDSRYAVDVLNMVIAIRAEVEGERLDVALARLGNVSRRLARRLIDFGAVTVDGVVVRRQSASVAAGARIRAVHEPGAIDVALPVRVVYRDRHFVVVAKPAGIPVGSTAVGSANSVVEALRGMARTCGAETSGTAGSEDKSRGTRSVTELPGPGFEPLAVHRLDLPVSGLLMVGNGSAAAGKLTELFEERAVTKVYLAIVAPTAAGLEFLDGIGSGTSTINARLKWLGGKARSIVADDGRPSASVVRRIGGSMLVAIRLATGRTHQARCHLAHVGLPVCGDRKYGPPLPSNASGGRIALHAAFLSFTHPWTCEPMTFLELPGPDFWTCGDMGDPGTAASAEIEAAVRGL